MAGAIVAALVSSAVATPVIAATTMAIGAVASAATVLAVAGVASTVIGGVVSGVIVGGGGGGGGGGGPAQPLSPTVGITTPSASAIAAQTSRGLLLNAASSNDPLNVIYGSRRVGGTYVLPPSVSGASNEYLHLVIVLCEGEISAINTVYLDGVPSSDSRFSGFVTVEKFLGTDTQAASSLLISAVPGWTDAHQGKGVAYLHVQCKYDKNVFTGMPVITCDVDGKKVYDPRTATTIFSNNPAVCIRDYLTSTRYGRGIASTLIDDSVTFTASANHCDNTVSTPAGTQTRYTCDGIVNVDNTAYQNIQSLIGCCRGMLVFSGGIYKLIIDKQETPSSFTFSESNITGSWQITRPGRKDKVNKVSANFFNASNNWQPDIAIQDSSTYRTQDNNLVLERKIDLSFTSDIYRAQHLAQLEMKSTRFSTMVSFNALQEGLKCEIGDVVYITHATPRWTAKPFRILTMDLLDNDNISVTAREYDDSAHTLDALSAIATAPTTNLPNVFAVGIPGNLQVTESLYETTGSAGVKAKATLSWIAPADAFVYEYEVDYKLNSSSVWIDVPSIRGTSFDFMDLVPGVYDFRVAAKNTAYVSGSYSPVKTVNIYGLTTAPGNVLNFTVRPFNGSALCKWDKTVDLDVQIGGGVVLRFCPLIVGASFEQSIILPDGNVNGDATTAVVSLAEGTYYAKFVDSTGHYSDTAASFVATEALVTGWATVATSTQHTSFNGVKTGCIATDSVLKLDSSVLVDSMGNVDTWGFVDSIGGLQASGTYEFDAVLDLTTIASRRFHAHIKSLSYNADDLIDSRLDMIDSWGDVDGGVINDTTALCYASVSDDNITYTNFAPFMVADFKCRYAKFKTILTSGDVTHNIQLSELSVTAKVPV